MVSDARKAANRKWDAANMTQLGCKLRRNKADAFKAACAEDGTTVNAVLLQAITDYMTRREKNKNISIPP